MENYIYKCSLGESSERGEQSGGRSDVSLALPCIFTPIRPKKKLFLFFFDKKKIVLN